MKDFGSKYYVCKCCGETVLLIKDTGEDLFCCGEKMEELNPASKDAAIEKHVPVYKVEGSNVTVCVGEIQHPMTEDHLIEWVSIQTTHGVQLKKLKPGDKPCVCFSLCEGEKIETVFAYCNLHGLWKA